MPEGDTVWRTADRLHRALAGAALTELELRWGELGGLALLPATTVRVSSRGKHLLHDLDTGVTLHTHLRMEGGWRILPASELTARARANGQLRLLAATSQWAALGLRLGLLEVWPSAESAARLSYLGPDILGAHWDLPRALGNLRATAQRPVGEALLDQRNLAGIGTMWAAESLFVRRLGPWLPVHSVPDDELASLLEGARKLMRRAADTGHQSSTGRSQRGENAYVHARSGRPCRRCGAIIRVAPTGRARQARLLFYCPSCQGGLAPGDDGRPMRPLGSTGRQGSTGRLG